jgi:hypothetical protein
VTAAATIRREYDLFIRHGPFVGSVVGYGRERTIVDRAPATEEVRGLTLASTGEVAAASAKRAGCVAGEHLTHAAAGRNQKETRTGRASGRVAVEPLAIGS